MSEDQTKAARPVVDASRDKDSAPGEPKARGRRRRKVSFLTLNKIDSVDYKDVATLRRFMNDRGKILPARQSGNTAKQQRMITQAIKLAREIALLPYVVTEVGPERRERRERSFDRGDRGDRGDRYGHAHREERAPAAESPTPAPEPETAAETPSEA